MSGIFCSDCEEGIVPEETVILCKLCLSKRNDLTALKEGEAFSAGEKAIAALMKKADEAERLLRISCEIACGVHPEDTTLEGLRKGRSPELADMSLAIESACNRLRTERDEAKALAAHRSKGINELLHERDGLLDSTQDSGDKIEGLVRERDEAIRKLALVMNPEAEKLREILKCAEELDENVEILMGHKEQLRKERDDLGILAITIERQNAIRDLVVKQSGAPDVMIDGSGEDSGDPWDLTLCEIGQGFGYVHNLIFDLFGPDFEGTLDEKVKAIHEQHVGLRRERDLVKEGSAEFEEECNGLRYRVKALEDDASKLSREIGTMQQHKIKLREERDHMRESRDGALEGYRLCDNRAAGYLANVIQLQTRLEEVRELYDQEHSKVDELQNDRNSWKTGYYIQKDYLALADALSDTARAACAEMSFEGTDGETRIAKTWLPVMEAEAAYRENKQSAMGPVNPVSDVRVDGTPLAEIPGMKPAAAGGVLKDPPPLGVDNGEPEAVVPLQNGKSVPVNIDHDGASHVMVPDLPHSMHSSARDDAPIQDLTEARKFDLEAAERERRVRLGMEVPGGITGDAELEAAFPLPTPVPWEKLWSAVTGCAFLSKDLFSDRCPVAPILREHAPPPPTPPEFERARREVMGPIESTPGTAEPLPCGSVPCVTIPIKFPSGTATPSEGETVECAVCKTMFYTELVITMDDVGGPMCSRCQDKEALACANIHREPIHIKHADLERSGESMYRSKCPTCKVGHLLVGRDQDTFELLPEDNCILCGQRFVYTDLDRLNECHGVTCPNCKRGFIRWSELKIGDTQVRCAYCNHVMDVQKPPDPEAEAEADARVEDENHDRDEGLEEQE